LMRYTEHCLKPNTKHPNTKTPNSHDL
jgi:hypothetical protein